MGEDLVFSVMGTKVSVSKSIVRRIVTTELSPLPHWEASDYLSTEEVEAFFGGASGSQLMKRIAKYILFYAENIVFATFLLLLAGEGKGRAEEYLDRHMELLETLRRIADKEEVGREDVEEMISLCLRHGIDPF